MPTTPQMLASYPETVLQVIAELRGAYLDAAENRVQAIELLSAQITDPTSVQMAYQEVIDMSEQAQRAIETLLKSSGEMIEAQFCREYGEIRQMGPAKLERESPWLYPSGVAELLYYYGLLGRGFKGTGQHAHTIVYLPADNVPWLPHPQSEVAEGDLPVQPAPPPPASRTLLAEDSFLEDIGSLLGFIYTERLRLTASGPEPEDVDQLVQRLQLPFGEGIPELDTRLGLLLHIANRLGWLRRGDGGAVQLTGNRVRAFLDKSRFEQRQILWQAWADSPDWNDLCRTPELECANTGNWQNDPLQTRQAILRLLGQLQPGLWYSQSDVIDAIKEAEPDFQRPTGDYDSWYIRHTTTKEFLKGFDSWDAVEGSFLRALFRGPLHWLGALDLAEPSGGDDLQFSLSQWGARWLGHDVPQPHEVPRRPILIDDDFTIQIPLGASLLDRFRVERFTSWQESYPQFTYQINQRSLGREAEKGISTQPLIDFFRERKLVVPLKVMGALERYRA